MSVLTYLEQWFSIGGGSVVFPTRGHLTMSRDSFIMTGSSFTDILGPEARVAAKHLAVHRTAP